MTPYTTQMRSELRLLGIAVVVASLPLFATLASAQKLPQNAYTDPASIDRAVVEFTGVPIGEVGGARMPADRRLRLAPCSTPLDVSWHGRNRSSLVVACAGPQSWRIFIAASSPAQSAPEAPIVSRGDPITVAVRGVGFTVQQAGEALQSGSVGDWIVVRTAQRAEPIRARIERPGLAVIPAS